MGYVNVASMKTARIVIFIIFAVALLWAGIWYNTRQDNQLAVAEKRASDQNTQTQNSQMDKLQIKDIVVGKGAEAVNGKTVVVHYTGTLDNGTKFDSSLDRQMPFDFLLGSGQVIKGWDLGVLGMKAGGKRELTIPSDLAYGERAVGPIPANSTLHFTVELLEVRN